MTDEKTAERIKYLVEFLNKCCDEYYNGYTPSLSDAEYDKLFDELTELENKYGLVLSNSPTQRAGYEVISELPKVKHDIQLLSLAKTKSAKDVYSLSSVSDGYLGLKMDGLTVKLVYTDGELTLAATRGDGNEGEVITHNAKVFSNIPKHLPNNQSITVSGEAYIDISTFNRINDTIENDEDKYSTPRNLAAGSVRQMDSRICKSRNVKFMPFAVLNGMDDIKSKSERLNQLSLLGFDRLPSEFITTKDSIEYIEESIIKLKKIAEENDLPIDGIVFTYDSISYSSTLGKTSHHYKDGIAYKFGDPTFETTLKNINWNISRTGQLTPIAEFKPVNIDNTVVERASLHNMTFVKNLKLCIGDKILVSKRNMIIPHIEENLSKTNNEYNLDFPKKCPICNMPTTVETTQNNNTTVEVLYCKNENCPGKQIKKFTHFVSKPAANIDGLSEATLSKFISNGWLKNISDIYSLSNHATEIASMEGFGIKSCENLLNAIENSKNIHLSNFLVSLNIGLMGKNAAKTIEDYFSGDVSLFDAAVKDKFDFSEIEGFGEIINSEIYEWFLNEENLSEYEKLKNALNFIKSEITEIDESNIFFGKTVVITGTFEKFTRDELSKKLELLGAKVTTSVSKKTDFVLCGENAGSKLEKAKNLSVKIITEDELNI